MNNQLNLISRYRTKLMGVAMLLILIFHTNIDVSNINIIRSLKDIGDVGVDIFLLLSGVGLYFSYSKNYNKINFYKRRIIRILPVFIPVAIVWYCANMIVYGVNFIDTALGITTLKFWIKGDMTWWFISAILLFYLITPIYIDIMNKNSKIVTLLTTTIFILIGLIIRFTFLYEYLGYLLVFLCRVPIFAIGIYLGKSIKEGYEIKINMMCIYTFTFISLIISILIVNPDYIYIPFALKYYIYIVLSFSICIIVSKIFYKLEGKNVKSKYMLLTFLGTYSLEMYLLHERILWILSFSEKFIIIDKYHIVLNIVAILISMLASYILCKVVIWIKTKKLKLAIG